jgi:hypothetical protein
MLVEGWQLAVDGCLISQLLIMYCLKIKMFYIKSSACRQPSTVNYQPISNPNTHAL